MASEFAVPMMGAMGAVVLAGMNEDMAMPAYMMLGSIAMLIALLLAAGAVTLPSWLSPWVDVSTWNAAVRAVSEAISSAQASLPALGSVLGWLTPAVWVFWGLGLALLLALAAGGHWLIGRR